MTLSSLYIQTVQLVQSTWAWLTMQAKPMWLALQVGTVWCAVQAKAMWLAVQAATVWCAVQAKPLWLTIQAGSFWCAAQGKAAWLAIQAGSFWCAAQAQSAWWALQGGSIWLMAQANTLLVFTQTNIVLLATNPYVFWGISLGVCFGVYTWAFAHIDNREQQHGDIKPELDEKKGLPSGNPAKVPEGPKQKDVAQDANEAVNELPEVVEESSPPEPTEEASEEAQQIITSDTEDDSSQVSALTVEDEDESDLEEDDSVDGEFVAGRNIERAMMNAYQVFQYENEAHQAGENDSYEQETSHEPSCSKQGLERKNALCPAAASSDFFLNRSQEHVLMKYSIFEISYNTNTTLLPSPFPSSTPYGLLMPREQPASAASTLLIPREQSARSAASRHGLFGQNIAWLHIFKKPIIAAVKVSVMGFSLFTSLPVMLMMKMRTIRHQV